MKVKDFKKKQRPILQAVDFFCSGGGMTSGFRMAGVNVIADGGTAP
jgi:hypothetical protein